jgi:RNA polymerase sigma factor (TIGR02999 family)
VSEFTRILESAREGNAEAADALLPLVYEELRRLAAAKMAQERPGHTLHPTALVHEAWQRLAGDQAMSWQNRAHFFSAAAEAMRRILVDRARRKARFKHGGHLERVSIDDVDVAANAEDPLIVAVGEALEELAQVDPMGAKLISLRFFAGMSNVEAAQALGLAERTAKRTWAYARAWLHAKLTRQDS